jgi:carbon starvation protein CstA
MNSVIVVIASGVLFLFGYTIYSKIIERFLKIDPKRKTPAYRKYDGVDYVPAKHWSILFGLAGFILFEAILAIRRIFRARRNALGIK